MVAGVFFWPPTKMFHKCENPAPWSVSHTMVTCAFVTEQFRAINNCWVSPTPTSFPYVRYGTFHDFPLGPKFEPATMILFLPSVTKALVGNARNPELKVKRFGLWGKNINKLKLELESLLTIDLYCVNYLPGITSFRMIWVRSLGCGCMHRERPT